MKFKSFIQSKSSRQLLLKNLDYFPLLLLILCFLIFGLLIPFLGFYWDDFPYLWFGHIGGPTGVFNAIALDRPLLGLFYLLPITLFKTSSVLWQVFAILSRWLFTISVYYFLKELWPERKSINKLLILLFLVYPGFSQQWISVIYSHIFLVFALYFYSLKIFTTAIRKHPRHTYLPVILSISISLLCMSAVEYVVGLEVLRPLIIYQFLSRKNKDSKRRILFQTLQLWLPYLISGSAFIIYRLFFARSVLYKQQIISDQTSTIANTIMKIGFEQFKNIWASVISAWGLVVTPLNSLDFSSKIDMIYLSLTFMFFIFAFFFSRRLLVGTRKSPDFKWIRETAVGSVISLLAAGLPFAAANLFPGIIFPSDRFFLPFILGSSTLVFILISLLQKKNLVFTVLFSLIFSLSASFQFLLADTYRKDWILFQDFIQQFSWRVPSIQADTVFITDDMPMRYFSDNSLTAPVNWLYASEYSNESLPYLMSFTDIRLGNSLKSLKPGHTIYHPYRTFSFSGSTDQMVYFYFDPPGCFHIADPELDILNPLVSDTIRFDLGASDPSLINYSYGQNVTFFTSEQINPSWCYYYQKASLAAQKENWSEVAHLADKAFSLDDYPNDASERMPYIEAFAMTGDLESAVQQSHLVHKISALYDPMLCTLWERIENNIIEEQNYSRIIQNIQTEYKCQEH